MIDGQDQRWRQRLTTFSMALEHLDEAVALDEARGLSELEKGGLVQRFEIAWELGWRLMADYVVAFEDPSLAMTPGSSIRAAAVVRLIDDRDGWLNAGKLRNILAHEYDRDRRDEGLVLVRDRFLPMMQLLLDEMTNRA